MTLARRIGLLGCMALVLALASGAPYWGLQAKPQVKDQVLLDAGKALERLKAGNARFVASKRTRSTDTSGDRQRRAQLVKDQHPLAAVLACADSRVSPEITFDRTIGELFVIRNAGNVTGPNVLASMEYAVEHLHVPLIVVMGHTGCGAVKAVNAAGDRPLPQHLRAIQKAMAGLEPAIRRGKGDASPKFLGRLVEMNARLQAGRLLGESEILARAVRDRKVRVVFGVYHLEDGSVTFSDLKPADRNGKP